MKRIFPIILVCFFTLFSRSFATHNRAGEITYKWISGNVYGITVTTYTKNSSCQADRCTIIINYGDGAPDDTIQRINGAPCLSGGCPPACGACGIPMPNDIKKNEYYTEHLYNPGSYLISVNDPNRNEGIMNMPNSVNLSFYIESTLIVSGFVGTNNSPVLDFPPVDIACVNKPFEHNPGAHDPDGDSLVFSLVPSMGAGGSTISGFTMPNNVPGCSGGTFSINSSTGLLSWNNPVCQGEFNVAILIKEYRNGYNIGTVLRDMQITVMNCTNNPPYIIGASQLCVFAGDTINELITAIDPDNGDNVTLTASGEPLNLSNSPATFIFPPATNDTVSSFFNWKTNCSHARNQKYVMTFRAEDTGIGHTPPVSLVDYHTLEITVIAPPVKNPAAVPQANNINLSWDPSYCPASGYKIYRRLDSAGFTPAFCQTGLPPGTGYSLIADCVSGNSYSDNNNGLGLIHGQKYCYVVVACLPGGENVVSQEFCAELKNDVPVITNVSVNYTDVLNGSDSIQWSMPKELDTLQWLPPYQYKIYRSTGFTPALTLVGTTASSMVLAFTDTSFVDTLLFNTQDTSYTYKIELYSNGALSGFSQNASSVFLSSAPTDNILNLSWEEHVPWVNSYYFIYKKNISTGDFDFLNSVATPFYSDTGLVNGAEYCYYVKSFGGYTSPGISSPLVNNSQIHCNMPVDDVPPCQPETISLEGNCDLFENTLTWNNPNNICTDDVVGYRIYYTPFYGGQLVLIKETSVSSSDTTFLNGNLNSIAGCYAVSAIDTFLNESPLSDTVCIDNCPVYELPNIFTPGSDGKNDFFHPFPYRFVAEINIQIFNRWGQLIFESNDPEIMWDGMHRKSKKTVPSGVYYYVCRVHEIRLEGIVTRVLKGYVHLLQEGDSSPQPNN